MSDATAAPPDATADADPDSPDLPEVAPRAPSGKLSGDTRTALAALAAKHAERVAAGEVDGDYAADGVMPASVPDLKISTKGKIEQDASDRAKATPPPADAGAPDNSAAQAIADRAAQRDRESAITAREEAIKAREAAIADREKRYGDVGEKLTASPLATMREIATQFLGAGATEDEISAEVSDMLTQASIELAGAKLDPNDDKQAIRQMRRELRGSRATERRNAEARAAADKAAADKAQAEKVAVEREQMVKGAIDTIGREYATIAPSTPFLDAEGDAPDLIWRVISRHHERTGEVMEIAAAAKKLDDELGAVARTKLSKLSHLLQPTAAGSQANATGQQGDQQRRSRPLTNADASEDAPPPRANGFLTPAEVKRQSIKALGPQFAALRAAARQEAGD